MRLKVQLLNTEYEKYYNIKKKFESDSGFDLYCVEDVVVEPFKVNTIKTGIKCQPFVVCCGHEISNYIDFLKYEDSMAEKLSGYYLYPRSSIAKTPLMLANSVGIIDIDYRGEILCKVRNMSLDSYTIKAGTSLFQLCRPDLRPFSSVHFVEHLNETRRNVNGFGSTN